ncbi:serine/threonine-protein kinase [Streptomyces sp. XM4193]|uniref:serine/threonine-protein kinase n=1 Tax=Streptomyces sp. XM4193 TaxID=2929782 RepID=UPI001FF97E8D|nr:serine/threonine-protein kinase [Streptomyces sp. XM4193]MCK1795535.1 serine/threonine-protein kinase [Streptomyces sp. XM4193]
MNASCVPAGYRIGRWVVEAPVAEGAFGSVYAAQRAEEASGGDSAERAASGGGDAAVEYPARAALKILPTGTSTPRRLRHLRELVAREVELLSRVRHPRLIRMYETLTVDDPHRPELDGSAVLVLELAARSLGDALDASGGTAPPGAARLLAEVCEGMAQLHREGWVHGDIKPSNVLLMDDGGVRLSDFNLAAEMEGSHAYSPAFSTPDYSPPELIWSEFSARGQQIRPTADIWAYGVLCHVVLTGTYPMPGGTASARREAAARYARGEEELRLCPLLPEDWAALIGDCLARTHQERARYGAAELAARVARLGGGRRVRTGRRPRLRLPPGRRTRLVALTATVATAVTAGTGAALVYERSGSSEPQGYERCLEGNVCFFTEPHGKGDMCAWWGDDTDWYQGEIKCGWHPDTKVASVYNNGKDVDQGEQYVDVFYFGEREFGEQEGCIRIGTRRNLDGERSFASHRWQVTCADPYEKGRNAPR